MPLHRYYADEPLEEASALSLDGAEAHHLECVVRAKLGLELELINGRGVLAKAIITGLKRGKVDLKLIALRHEAPPKYPLVLLQALPRAPRLDFIIEKATELGVKRMIFFPGEKSERKSLSEQQWQRMISLSVAALKQSGGLYLPELIWSPSLQEAAQCEGVRYFGDLNPSAPPLMLQWNKPKDYSPVLFCVGPESGLSAKEEELLRNYGWIGVCLHPHILRTDTAPLVALALLSHLIHFGDSV